jgi:hypothetical protein
MTTLRQATESDFKVGATLITSEGYEFTIYSYYSEGIFEARSSSGSKCLFSGEARFYKVAQ